MAEFYGLVVSGEAEVITAAQKLEAIRKLCDEYEDEALLEVQKVIDILEGRLP